MTASVSMRDPKAWLLKAKADLAGCRACLRDSEAIELVAYHAQQASEKALKAFLVFHNKEVKKTHDLEFLVDACVLIDYSFIQLLSYASDLNDYITSTRYPDDYMAIGPDEAKAAYKKATFMCNFIIKRLPEGFETILGTLQTRPKQKKT